MIAGPIAMNSRGPCRAASLPNRVENSTSSSDEGMPRDARRLLVVAQGADQEDPLERQGDVQGAVDHAASTGSSP